MISLRILSHLVLEICKFFSTHQIKFFTAFFTILKCFHTFPSPFKFYISCTYFSYYGSNMISLQYIALPPKYLMQLSSFSSAFIANNILYVSAFLRQDFSSLWYLPFVLGFYNAPYSDSYNLLPMKFS